MNQSILVILLFMTIIFQSSEAVNYNQGYQNQDQTQQGYNNPYQYQYSQQQGSQASQLNNLYDNGAVIGANVYVDTCAAIGNNCGLVRNSEFNPTEVTITPCCSDLKCEIFSEIDLNYVQKFSRICTYSLDNYEAPALTSANLADNQYQAANLADNQYQATNQQKQLNQPTQSKTTGTTASKRGRN